MPTERLSMCRIRDVPQLRYAQGMGERAIAASLGLGTGTVDSYLSRARRVGIGWPPPDDLDDDGLKLLLFPASPMVPQPERLVPDWTEVDRDRRRPGMTRAFLREGYRATYPSGFGYTWFCTHFEASKGRVRPTMHLAARAVLSSSRITLKKTEKSRHSQMGRMLSRGQLAEGMGLKSNLRSLATH